MNLTAARSPVERVRLLVAPVVPVAPRLGRGRLVDVGSGNGSPGLVLALLRPDLAVTLLEPRLKRWAFLREAARACGRPDIQIARARHDEYAGPPASIVTVRALALTPADLAPLTRKGGRLVVFGPAPAAPSGWSLEPPTLPGITILRRD